MKSHHHQGVERIGDGLVVTGRADDDEVEAVEAPERRFALGVLWHPEEDEESRVSRRSWKRCGRAEERSVTITVLEPATEQTLAELPAAGVEETDAAVERARAAFPAWRAVTPAGRSRMLHDLADALEERQEELAQLEARNAGKPIADARGEMGMVVETFRYYAGAPERLLGDTIPVAGGVRHDLPRAARRGRADRALELPADDRLVEDGARASPPATRSCSSRRSSRRSPRSSSSEIALEAGLPEGVVNVVAGPGRVCGQRLVEHPDVAKVAFTGSTEVGRRIAAGAAATIKRVTLELGGKSAEHRVRGRRRGQGGAVAPFAVFGNAGQDCCARSRILVERSVLDSFMSALEDAVRGDRASATRSTRPPRWAR